MPDSVDPGRPLLIFDGKCGFCRIWIDFWKQMTGDRVAYAPYQEAATAYPEIPRESFQRAVHLIRPDRTFASGARAVFETIRPAGVLVWLYEHLAGFAPITEAAYKFVGGHRDLFYQVTKYTFGLRIEPARFERTQWLFLRLLALIYAIAFASFGLQVTGLIGEHGIAPAQEFFKALGVELGRSRYYDVPSVFWLSASDFVLRGGCWAGVAVAALLFLGRLERICLILLYVLYLSYSMAGQVFMGFQWDLLRPFAGWASNHRVVIPMAGVPALFPLGIREAGKRRPGVEIASRPGFSLSYTASADCRRMVRG
jgi:lipase maturation factor 1